MGTVPDGTEGWDLPDGFLALVLAVASHRHGASGPWHEALLLHGDRVGWAETTRLVTL